MKKNKNGALDNVNNYGNSYGNQDYQEKYK